MSWMQISMYHKRRLLIELAALVSMVRIAGSKLVVAPKDVDAVLGTSVTFNCSSTINETYVQWVHYPIGKNMLIIYAYGKVKQEYSHRFSVTDRHNLIISPVRMDDAGTFECQDDYGRGEKRSAELIVLESRPSCRSNSNLDNVVGENTCGIEPGLVILTCSVQFQGKNAPKLEWQQNGEKKTITCGVSIETQGNRTVHNLTLKGDSIVNGSSYNCHSAKAKTIAEACNSGTIMVTGYSAAICQSCKDYIIAFSCIIVLLLLIFLGQDLGLYIFFKQKEKRKLKEETEMLLMDNVEFTDRGLNIDIRKKTEEIEQLKAEKEILIRRFTGGRVIGGYYGSWSRKRPGGSHLYPEDICAALCTHLSYAVAVIKDGHLAPFEFDDEEMFVRFTNLKKKNPGLKTLLSVGGYYMGSESFSQVVSSLDSRTKFIDHSIAYLRKWNFDGLDVHWQFPGQKGFPEEKGTFTNREDKGRFTSFLQELHAAYVNESSTPGHERLLLTVAVSAEKKVIDVGYDIAEISKVVDFISFVGFDMRGGLDKKTGLNSPLYMYAPSRESSEEARFCQRSAVKYLKKKGAPAEKIVLGLAAYGRSFTLADPDNHDSGAAATGSGKQGDFTKQDHVLSYYEICKNGWPSTFQREQIGMYAYSGDQWVGYDDPNTMQIKAKYIIDNGLGGAMLWTFDLDDWKGEFGEKRTCPLLKAIAYGLKP